MLVKTIHHDHAGRTIWIVDAHGYGKRFIVRSDEKLTAFFELERAIPRLCGGFDLVMAAQRVREYPVLRLLA